MAEEMQMGRLSPLSSKTMLLAAMAAMLTACANSSESSTQFDELISGGTRQIADVQPVKGFLPQPSLLQPGGNGRASLYYLSPKFVGSSYKNIILDPVAIWTGPNSKLSDVPQEQRQALVDTFQADLVEALGKKCRLITKPAPGTMRIRVAIVDAVPTDAAVNTVASYTPIVSAANAVAARGFNGGVGYFTGSATAEGYAVDATTGKLLWEGVDKRGGTTAAAPDTLNTWLDVQHSFQAWSNMFVQRLTELGACGAG